MPSHSPRNQSWPILLNPLTSTCRVHPLQFLPDFLVNRGQLLTMSAPEVSHVLPWHVVLDEDMWEKSGDIVQICVSEDQDSLFFGECVDGQQTEDGQKDNF